MLFLGTTSGTHSEDGFEGVIDPPLESGQGSDHYYTRSNPRRAQLVEAHFTCDLTEAFSFILFLAQLRDHAVCWMRHHCTHHSCYIA